MRTKLDAFINNITMYRLVLYVLIVLLGIATILATFHILSFTPLALLASVLLLLVMCGLSNFVLATIFNVPANIESTYITALILALIINPAQTPNDYFFLGWAAILAMSSKYILSIGNKHLFNPAAIAVVITSFALGESASWWVGTISMLSFVLVGGFLIAYKMRQVGMTMAFCATVILISIAFALFQGRGAELLTVTYRLIIGTPLLFFAFVMLTEPLTEPPTRHLRLIYALLVGIFFTPQVHIGSFYAAPELALVIGNLFAYLVSPKYKLLLTLSQRIKLAPGYFDFVFKPPRKLTYRPGQYMEFTLAHPHPDSRGNRRYFTLASSPTESQPRLGIRFYSPSSTYKQAMLKMNGKAKLMAAQVAGDFTLPDNPRQKLVFIAGGIGITPFRSMLKYLLDTRQRRDIVLFYINRHVNEIVYTDVFNAVQQRLGIKVIYALTDLHALPPDWQGLTGRVNAETLQWIVPDYQERTYYLSGPPAMVSAYEETLRKMHVGGHQIKKDFFPGLV